MPQVTDILKDVKLQKNSIRLKAGIKGYCRFCYWLLATRYWFLVSSCWLLTRASFFFLLSPFSLFPTPYSLLQNS